VVRSPLAEHRYSLLTALLRTKDVELSCGARSSTVSANQFLLLFSACKVNVIGFLAVAARVRSHTS
jgi:hypothetical protein